MCEKFSLKHICRTCQKNYLTPSLYKRHLQDGTLLISFYKYEDIKEFLFTKHTDIGFHIYTIMAQKSFQKFAKDFFPKEQYLSIAIDDIVSDDYSHTAILNRHLHSHYIKQKYSIIRAKNRVSYSGKSREFRLKNPRNFHIKPFKEREVIVVDDIVTTGSTLLEAIQTLKDQGKETLFCLTLCDVSNR